ncbi:MAG: ABC transporter permease [Eubacterium sp.]
MNLRENIILAFEGLLANKMRALLTMLGIIIGIASVITITSLGGAMSNTMASSMENLGGKNIQVFLMPKDVDAAYTPTNEDLITNDMITRLKERYSNDIKGVSFSVSVGAGKTIKTAPSHDLSITGTNPDYFDVQNIKMIKGRTINDHDVEGEKNVIVISSLFSHSIFGSEVDPIGKEIQIETKDGSESFYVVGVYLDPKEETSQNNSFINFSGGGSDRSNVYIPVSVAKKMVSDTSSGYSNIMVKTANDVNSSEFSGTVSEYLTHFYPKNSNMKIETQSMESIVSEMKTMMGTMSLVIAIIAGISLLVGGIGVMNIMLVSVTERTREIGIRKALGAKNSAIRIQFIVESMIICFIGGVIGILLGTGFGAIGGILIKAPVTPSLGAITIAVLFSMAIGIFFGYYPANKAAKLNPIDALHYE